MLLIWGGNGQTGYICDIFPLKPYRVYRNASDIQRGTYTQLIPVPSWLLYIILVNVWPNFRERNLIIIELGPSAMLQAISMC